MNVFVIGATGYIGAVVVEKLLAAGHRVVGLARTSSASSDLLRRGVTPHAGDLEDPRTVAAAARANDATIFAAHGPSYAVDRAAFRAIVDVLEGSEKCFVYTSGAAIFSDRAAGEPSEVAYDEDTPFVSPAAQAERARDDAEIVTAAARGVRAMIMRPGLVYGRSGSIQVPIMIAQARRSGVSRFIGRGQNRWTNVHVDDLAELYVKLLERAPGGTVVHPCGGEATMRVVAAAIGRSLGIPCESWTVEQAATVWNETFAQDAIGSNCRMIGTKSRAYYEWSPTRPDLLWDLEYGSYRGGQAEAATSVSSLARPNRQ
ncbi:MAG TPA: NAD-dependent epimerase/dehydratase family protein [Kofleriaceae bacterium]|nr:NAD-dependent epimerase/dehydratase family protein [Kofleriaceae bacterium]